MNPSLISTALILISTGLMIYGAQLALGISRRLPRGSLLKWWNVLPLVMAAFAVGYFVFAMSVGARGQDPGTPLLVAVFFFGAVFVVLALHLFRYTLSSVEKSSWLDRDSILDGPTGIYNLRYFDLRLNEEFERTRRYQSPLTLMLVEIDNFHGLTSTYDRGTKEKALAAVCTVLKQCARASDILARYGDDQIIILLPSTALFNGRKAAEKFRAVMEDKMLEIEDQRNVSKLRLNCTTSIGVAGVNNEVKRASELIRRADIALGKAKDEGRNRLAIYGE